MESSDVFSYIGALGAIATVIALIPEKNRMAAFSFLKKILRQVLNFFRKAIKTAELETIQETAPEAQRQQEPSGFKGSSLFVPSQ